MNIRSASSLMEKDVEPFRLTPSVVRFYRKWWIAGMLHTTKVENDLAFLWISPLVRFGHRQVVDPADPGTVLVTHDDRPIQGSYIISAQPFRLCNPQRLEWDGRPKEVLVISFEDGTAILSSRQWDIAAVDHLLRMVREEAA